MSRIIAALIEAGVAAELVADVADEIAKARAEGAASVSPARSARQERNKRYYDTHRCERLKASESKTIKTLSDAIKTESDASKTLSDAFKTIKTLSDAPSLPSSSSPPHPPNNYTSPSQHTPSASPRGVPRAPRAGKPASRLSAEWVPDGEDRAFAADEGFDEPEIDRIAEQFRDHWLSKAGQDALKADWHATWRNWIRRDNGTRSNGPRGRGPRDAVAQRELTLEANSGFLATASRRRTGGRGPPPPVQPRSTRGVLSALAGIAAFHERD